MNFNFELILFYATIVCGVFTLVDVVFFAPARKKKNIHKMPVIFDYARSFFPVLLIVFLLRSFLFEPFRIPSGSLEPTLDVGDFILVNKFDYGVRLPVIHNLVYPTGKVHRGDIIVFRYPAKPSIDYIKRVIGVPGDHISYINKVLYVNGQEAPQTFVQNTTDRGEDGTLWDVTQKEENFLGLKHQIYQTPSRANDDFKDVVVPEGYYFAMGDNRDDSADSRYWGFVPEKNLIGKASVIWLSWNADGDLLHKIRWHRVGTVIH